MAHFALIIGSYINSLTTPGDPWFERFCIGISNELRAPVVIVRDVVARTIERFRTYRRAGIGSNEAFERTIREARVELDALALFFEC